ncbi:DEAD/DEAH box helicase family protein [Alkalibacterium sp. 20]|uniref:DEAD/DEAH box helicase family protein n=1 Tax=Alkalibacterium sp. 20 TaxID=1798803 RepID=UPI00090025FA|nr:DEAD/DEAH box helicase family protein [Alkalibacterium sp. 20]OJF93023.1 restriction endonuclease subunit R [Alkalibacterium sp. 20]
MSDIRVYKQEDLMLKVSHDYNPYDLPLEEWDEFLDVLCGNREYQKKAIINSVIFLASKNYRTTEDLAIENFNSNTNLQQKYTTLNKFISTLQVKNKLHANIDLATGTGKSYVIYGISQIMLGLGLIKRVLVLCPSLTIEKGLMNKFIDLAIDPELKAAIPENAVISKPSIIDANKTITEGDICVENIHAVYDTTGSSIRDSFKNGGEDTLVLNDESHHIYNELQSINSSTNEGKNIKRWKEFLINPKYKFNYILGFTGTAYTDNEYFSDVIYRYSLRESIDERMVKSIEYVQEDDTVNNDYEKFQKIFHNHKENKRKYSKIKPITIMVTKDIKNAENLYADFCDFLVERKGIILEEAEKKVLIVTSSSKHKSNIPLLDTVDNSENPIEWIISVSMLTEGWDVKNVFQIVPWEDRAFNSKLLISQVLGRGLRIPESYSSGSQPIVIVFNHASWSKNIENLVNEVLEIETRLHSSVKYSNDRNKYNFTVHNLPYDKSEKEVNHKEDRKDLDYSKTWKEGIKLTSQPDHLKRVTSYEDLSSGLVTSRKYDIQYKTRSIDEVVNKIIHGFRTRDWEGGILGLGSDEVYDKKNLPKPNDVRLLIRKSMDKVGIEGNNLSEENANRVMSTFNTLFRKSSKTVVLEKKSEEPYVIETSDMNNESLGLSSFRRAATLFYTTDYLDTSLNEEQKFAIQIFLEDDSFPKRSSKKINKHLFKTPVNYLFTTETPEYEFTKQLSEKDNAEVIESWIKSRDRGFYQIEYSIRIASHQRQRNFNPDYFIKCKQKNEDIILVVEIKDDKDDSPENKAKYKYALKHFAELNKKLEEKGINERYILHFLTPKDYQTFFQYVINGNIFKNTFKSELEVLLESDDTQ